MSNDIDEDLGFQLVREAVADKNIRHGKKYSEGKREHIREQNEAEEGAGDCTYGRGGKGKN